MCNMIKKYQHEQWEHMHGMKTIMLLLWCAPIENYSSYTTTLVEAEYK